MRKIKPKRRGKPYPDFPLFLHATGQWAKKIRGRMYYFGTDPEAALRKYLDERDDLMAGRRPRGVQGAGLTVMDACNRFLTNRKVHYDAGELSLRTFVQYSEACQFVMDRFTKTRLVTDLRPSDFESLRAHLAKTHGPYGLAGRVQHIRTLFKFLFENDVIQVPVKIGTSFKRPPRKVMRQARHAAGPRMLEADQLRDILTATKQPLRAMILLALNCGFGASDISGLPRSAIDLERGWIDYPRPKTAVPRRIPLWPETVDAVSVALADRPDAKGREDADLAFLTRCGQRWVRVTPRGEKDETVGEFAHLRKATVCDAIGGEFKKVLKASGCNRPKLGFYVLRHVHRTVADGAKDQPAANVIMGHAADSGDMAAVYRERVDDDRLRAVVDHVRAWLWPANKGVATLPFSRNAV